MATIQKIIPCNIDERQVKQIYDSFVENQHKAFLNVTDNIRKLASPVFAKGNESQEDMNALLMQASVSANIFKILTENITKNAGKE